MNFSLSNKRIENAIQLTNSIFPLIILPLATVGNLLCFLVFCRPIFQKRLTRTSSICLRLLCINDLILLYLFTIDVLLKVYMEPSKRIYSTPETCRLYKFIRYSFLDMSAYLQLGLTTDRFICCVHHTYYSHWRKKNYLYYLLMTAFVLIILKNSSFLSPLYGYTAPSHKRNVTKCSVKKEAAYFARYMAYGQSLIDVIFITCVPFFLIVYFNSRILREVLRLRPECWSTLTKIINLKPGQNQNSNRPQTVIFACSRSRRRRLHLTFALGCISFVFVLSAAPYKFFKIVERHDKVVRDRDKYGASKSIKLQLAEVIIDCLQYFSCSTPFFVCFTTSSMFREELHLLFQ
ncbi:unnamed protein product [Rotaria sp. Silwood1]|nr:unnamed protein product [Rotaria sp. Silwood1]CAF3535088.1 unnamed protein product [Rotaria sp. Silwood1]CAF3569232.1 unnamed protein product [Rotaria sp. Silwood1]CAF3593216.1 unnamed protein product [Rotaria sp. Silwood1]CAF4512394.1 unnamed protein product [Rotaria sp. Silwood1]